MDLSEFLLARIAEDEKAAREYKAMTDAYHREMEEAARRGAVPGVVLYDFTLPGGAGEPGRILAECDAKRQIVELDICTACDVEGQPCDHRDSTLRLLALPYADHPDYRAEWKI